MRRLSILFAVFAMAFAVMPAATAQRSMLHAEFEGVGIPDFDPVAISERCPDIFQWIYNTEGSGTMETAVFSGDFKATGSHCSRWLHEPPTDPDLFYQGRLGVGLMTLETAEGTLVIHYNGRFRFQGDLSLDPPSYQSDIRIHYRIDGELSTGVFEGALGRGLLKVTDRLDAGVPSFTAQMRGPIRFAS